MPSEPSGKVGVNASFLIPSLAKLANFKPAKMPVKRELGQLRQLSSMRWCGLKTRPQPTKAEDGLGGIFALREIGQEIIALVKLANFEPAKTPIKTEVCQLGQLFFDAMVGLEDSTAPYESRRWLMTQPVGSCFLATLSDPDFNPSKKLRNS